VETANLLAFLILGNAKQKSQIAYILRCACCPAKSNKSHLGMPMVTKRHFITVNISPEGQPGSKGKDTRGSSFPCSSSGVAHG